MCPVSVQSDKPDYAPIGAELPPMPRVRIAGAWALLFVALLVLYGPALRGGLLWDDADNLTRPELRSVQGLSRIWFQWGATQTYYPVLHTLYWVEYQIWGDATLGYHVASILFHSVSVCLVYLIVRRLQIPGAILAAAIFAVHPVYVESVAWITEQKNTLSVMFSLLSMLAYLRFDERRRGGAYVLAMAFFLLALASKTTAVTLPLALVIVLWWRRTEFSWRRDFVPLLPWFALSLLVGMFTVWYERVYVGVRGTQFELSPVQKCLLASRAVWFYLEKLIWPAQLTLIYPRWEVDAAEAWQYLYLLGLAALLGWAWAMRRRSRAPWAALLFFVGTLFPLLGIFPTYIFSYTYVCDHFQYFPSLGIVVLVSAAIAQGLNRLTAAGQLIGRIACVAVLGVLAWLTWQQSSIYRDAITMYENILAKNPTSWMAHNNLGLELVRTDRQKAVEHYLEALRIRPDYPQAHNNLGIVLRDSGHLTEANDQFQQALNNDSKYTDAHVNLGLLRIKQGNIPAAVREFEDAVRLSPDYALAQNDLASALYDSGRPADAIKHYREAVRLRPDYVEAHNGLGNALMDSGRPAEAADEYREVLRLQPVYPDAHANLDRALREQARLPQAKP